MPPIIPTCRPLVTPLRAAITIAVLALASSVVPAIDAAQGGSQTSAQAVGAGQACVDRAGQAHTVELVASAVLNKPPTP
jgi:hypothetical protein